MGKVIFNITMSLDGFVAGPNDAPERGLGEGGDALFNWITPTLNPDFLQQAARILWLV